MAIPKLEKTYICAAIKYIEENGIPQHNTSTKYGLLWENGKQYPPKYVIAVANYLQNGGAIDTTGFNTIEAKNYLVKLGYSVQSKQEKLKLIITAAGITSTDDSFTMDRINDGDSFRPLDVSFVRGDGTVVKRNYAKLERRNSNQTLPRLAFQVFEKQIAALSAEEREQFPICRYTPNTDLIRGIYRSVAEFKEYKNTIEYLPYNYGDGRQFVIYCWNIFSTLLFVQECLKRFGQPGDSFQLIYREKDEKESAEDENEGAVQEELAPPFNGYQNPYSAMLVESKNIIFRGAPGTGKTYLAKEIAADIISDGYYSDYAMLSPEQKEQVEFVQFHPSYDYSDFVEGLRPRINGDGTMGFELRDGVFKAFVDKARENYENSRKPRETIAKELSVQDEIREFFSEIEFSNTAFALKSGNQFTITDVDEKHIYISVPENPTVKTLVLNIDELKRMLESGKEFKKVKDVTDFFEKEYATQGYSYDYILWRTIVDRRKKKKPSEKAVKQEGLKKYIFIIDEINRGEISKIFGELFFAIDPGYRGMAGEVSTQYANLHSDPKKKFYIPENVYIIGTMNDIDRSVDSFDFAMRRRFRFVELKAEERLEMLADLNDEEKEAEAIRRMTSLNREIAQTEGLSENYQIGAAYFLKLRTVDFDQLWADYLCPLLQEYINGMYNEAELMDRFRKVYYDPEPDGEISDGSH